MRQALLPGRSTGTSTPPRRWCGGKYAVLQRTPPQRAAGRARSAPGGPASQPAVDPPPGVLGRHSRLVEAPRTARRGHRTQLNVAGGLCRWSAAWPQPGHMRGHASQRSRPSQAKIPFARAPACAAAAGRRRSCCQLPAARRPHWSGCWMLSHLDAGGSRYALLPHACLVPDFKLPLQALAPLPG